MKKWLVLSLLVYSAFAAAQYYVYIVNGDAILQRKGQQLPLYTSTELFEEDIIQTSEYGNVVILDRYKNKTYSIQSSEPKPLRQLIVSSQSKSRSLAGEFIEGLYNKLFGKSDRDEAIYKTQGGVTYRGDPDDEIVAAALNAQGKSAYAISMTLLDLHTLQPVEQLRENQIVILQINNLSDTPLYVNVIDIDANNKATALFSTDEVEMIMNLYIPPLSNVRLSNYPITFAPAYTADRLILVAYPMPFDLAHVLSIRDSIPAQFKPLIGRYDTTITINP